MTFCFILYRKSIGLAWERKARTLLAKPLRSFDLQNKTERIKPNNTRYPGVNVSRMCGM